MSQASLSMRKIEEILRLKFEVGLTHRAIAQSCGVSTSTVSEYSTHAKAAGLSWPLPEGLTAEQLEARLFPEKGGYRRKIPQPDWQYVHKELKRKGVTLSLLWVEYRQEHPKAMATASSATATGSGSSSSTPPCARSTRPGRSCSSTTPGRRCPWWTRRQAKSGQRRFSWPPWVPATTLTPKRTGHRAYPTGLRRTCGRWPSWVGRRKWWCRTISKRG